MTAREGKTFTGLLQRTKAPSRTRVAGDDYHIMCGIAAIYDAANARFNTQKCKDRQHKEIFPLHPHKLLEPSNQDPLPGPSW